MAGCRTDTCRRHADISIQIRRSHRFIGAAVFSSLDTFIGGRRVSAPNVRIRLQAESAQELLYFNAISLVWVIES